MKLSRITLLLVVSQISVAAVPPTRKASPPRTPPPSTACLAADRSYYEHFSDLISTLRDQVALAKATPRIALSQRIADLQKSERDLRSSAIPDCPTARPKPNGGGESALARIDRETAVKLAALEGKLVDIKPCIDFADSDCLAAIAKVDDHERSWWMMRHAMNKEMLETGLRAMLSADEDLEKRLATLNRDTAIAIRLKAWKSAAQEAASLEIAPLLAFMANEAPPPPLLTGFCWREAEKQAAHIRRLLSPE